MEAEREMDAAASNIPQSNQSEPDTAQGVGPRIQSTGPSRLESLEADHQAASNNEANAKDA